jgi:ribosome-binding protein aMBF1 (putative translation factor)
MSFDDEGMVDALEEGRIVKVSEEYAKKEGLAVLRRYAPKGYGEKAKSAVPPVKNERAEMGARAYKRGILSFEDLRKPLDWKKHQIVQELVEDFHWVITKARREKNMTRKQLANAIKENEETVKKLENGIMPTNDFVLVNKIQDYLNINLRKDGKDFRASARASLGFEKISKAQPVEGEGKIEGLEEVEIHEEEDAALFGDDIEVVK